MTARVGQVVPGVHQARIHGGDTLPVAGGVLLAGDAAAHVSRLSSSVAYEDLALGLVSLAMLGSTEVDVACFSHGRPIVGGASRRFARRWS